MNVRIRQQFNIIAGLVYKDQYTTNLYQITLDMRTHSHDSVEQNIAYERIKYWIEEVLADSVLICDDDPMIEAHRATGRRMLVLPVDPIDSVLSIAVYNKTNAVAEGRIEVVDVALASSEGRDIIYLHGSEEEDVELLVDQGWWHEVRPYCIDHTARRKIDTNIIALDRMPEWADLALGWVDEVKEASTSTTTVTTFQRNEEK